MNQLVSEIQELQNKVNSLTDARDFHDPEGPRSPGASHVPTRPLTIPSRSEKPSREPAMPNDTRNAMGISGNVFESLPAREGQFSPRFENSRNLALSPCEMKQDSRMRRDAQSSTIPNPSQEGVQGPLFHSGGTYSRNGVMYYPRFSILEMHLGTFPDPMEFQSWKVNFKTEVCASSQFPRITMHWITKIEMAKSTDDLKTSQSITGRTDFPDYDLLDAKIASVLKKLITNMHFRRRVCTEELRAQNETRFLRGRQIAFMIYEHFRATGAYDAVQDLSDLFNVRLQNDDAQDFDTRWDESLLSASEVPTEMVLEGSYKSKLHDSVQLQTTLAMYEQEIIRNNEQPNYSRLKIAVRRHIDQQTRTRNIRARNEIVERGAVTKRPKGRKAVVERTVGECHQWKAIGQCSRGDSCSFSHEEASGNGRGQRQEEQTSSPAPSEGTDGRKVTLKKSSGHRGDNPSGTRGRFPCRALLKGKCTNSSCNYWHPPVCLNHKSETGCANGKKCRFRHVEIDGQTFKKSKKSGKGSVALLMESRQLGCVSHDSHSKKIYSLDKGKLGSDHAVKFSMAPHKHSGKKGSIARRHSEV